LLSVPIRFQRGGFSIVAKGPRRLPFAIAREKKKGRGEKETG